MIRPLAAGPLFVWLVSQVAAIALACFRIPPAAGYPRAAELQAVRVLIAIQLATSTALFPILCDGVATTLAAVCSAWVMLLIAAAAAAQTPGQVAPFGGYLTAWLIGLAILRSSLRDERWRLIAAAVFSTSVVGGPLVCYLRNDLGTRPQSGGPAIVFGPLQAIESNPIHFDPRWWLPPALLICFGIAWKFRRRRRTAMQSDEPYAAAPVYPPRIPRDGGNDRRSD